MARRATAVAIVPVAVVALFSGSSRDRGVTADGACLAGDQTHRTGFELARRATAVVIRGIAVVAGFLDDLACFDLAVAAVDAGLAGKEAVPGAGFDHAGPVASVATLRIPVVARLVRPIGGAFLGTVAAFVAGATRHDTDEPRFDGGAIGTASIPVLGVTVVARLGAF